jgi:hypothetical protein
MSVRHTGSAFADFDRDGNLDLYITATWMSILFLSMNPRQSANISVSRFSAVLSA